MSLLLAYDYFPFINELIEIPKIVFIGIFIGFFIINLIMNRKIEDGKENRSELKWNLFIILYIIAVMIIFSLLGGGTSVGISFSNILFWIVLGITLIICIFNGGNRNSRKHKVNKSIQYRKGTGIPYI